VATRPIPRQTHSAEQPVHPFRYIHHIPQRIRFRIAYAARITHLPKQLCNDIIARFDFAGQQRGSQKVFEYINQTVEEFQNEERLSIGRRRYEKEYIRLDKREQCNLRVGIGQVRHRGSRRRMCEVEGKHHAGCCRSRSVDVLQN